MRGKAFVLTAAGLAACTLHGTTLAQGAEADRLFVQGATANREARFPAALDLLRRAEAQGYSDPELHFELGWAAMGSGQARACIERLERFESLRPGRGQTAEFLGRCHLALGEHSRADTRLRQARERDPRLAPTVDLSLAALEQARGDERAAREHFASASSADAPTGRALRELAGPPEPIVQPMKPFRASISVAAGYNDNVIGLGNTIPLPSDISRKGATFVRLAAGASYSGQLAPRTGGTVGYALLADRYDGISGSNLNDHFVYGDVVHELTADLGLSLRLSAEITQLGDRHYRDALAARPAVAYRFGPNAVSELSYSHTISDYKTSVPANFNRDGTSHSFSLVHSVRFPGTRFSGAIGATYAEHRPEGADFRADSIALSGTLRYSFPNRVMAAVGLSVSQDDYANRNSLAGAGFAYNRQDSQTTVNAQIAGPLTDRIRWYVQAQRLRNASNIAFYDFKQSVVSAGIAADF